MTVLFGTVFFVSTITTIVDIPTVSAITADTPELKKAKRQSDKEALAKAKKEGKAVDEGTTEPRYSKKVIENHLNSTNGMDWVRKNIIQFFKMWHESAGLTDLSVGGAHLLADLFSAITLYLVYLPFDTVLSTMYNVDSISSSVNTVFGRVQTFAGSAWSSDVFKQLLYLAFAVGVIWAGVLVARRGNAMKHIIALLLIAVLGGAWVEKGGDVLQNFNKITTTLQTMAFTATSVNNGENTYTDTSNFENAVRKYYFTHTMERTYSLGNFNTTSLQDSEKDGSYRLIGGDVDDDVLSALAKDNDNLSKNGNKEWYQVSIAIIGLVTCFAYGVPLFMIGFLNLLLQLGSVGLYIIAPFTVLLSLIPRFTNSALKTVMVAIGLLFGKIGLIFAITFVSWVGTLVDGIVPVTDSGTALANSVLYFFLLSAVWRYRKFIVQTISGSSVANSALDKLSVTRAGRSVRNAGQELVTSTRNGYGRVQSVRDSLKRKGKNKGRDDDNERSRDDDDNNNVDKRGYQGDPNETERLAKERQQARQDKLNQEENSTDTTRHGHAEEIPVYRRNAHLLSRDNHSVKNKDDKGSYEPSKRRSYIDEETITKTAQKRSKARSDVLEKSPRYNNTTEQLNQRRREKDEAMRKLKEDMK